MPHRPIAGRCSAGVAFALDWHRGAFMTSRTPYAKRAKKRASRTSSKVRRTKAPSVPTVPVTVANFARAETHMYFANSVRQGALGRIVHLRTPTPIDKQDVIRMNRDTL